MVGKVAIVALSTIVHILPLRKHYQQNANYFLFFLHFSYESLHYCQKSITFTAEKVKASAEPWQKAVAKQMIEGTIICIQSVLVDQINFYPI